MSSFYKQIDGIKYSAKLLSAADSMVAGVRDNVISKSEVRHLLELLRDDNRYSDLEQRTIAYIQQNYSFTDAADQFFRQQIDSWVASLSSNSDSDDEQVEQKVAAMVEGFVLPEVNRNKFFDTRVVKRYIGRSLIEQKEYDQYIEELEDCSDLAVSMETQFMHKVQAEKKQQNQEEKEQ